MKQAALILMFMVVSNFSFGCTCGQNTGSYFLKNVKYFDAVAEGSFYRNAKTGIGYLLINKVYKGSFKIDTIKVAEGGTDCTQVFTDEPGKKFIFGLVKSTLKSNQEAYSIPACITFVLMIDDTKVYSKFSIYNMHITNPKIGLFCTQIRKDKLAKKIRDKV